MFAQLHNSLTIHFENEFGLHRNLGLNPFSPRVVFPAGTNTNPPPRSHLQTIYSCLTASCGCWWKKVGAPGAKPGRRWQRLELHWESWNSSKNNNNGLDLYSTHSHTGGGKLSPPVWPQLAWCKLMERPFWPQPNMHLHSKQWWRFAQGIDDRNWRWNEVRTVNLSVIGRLAPRLGLHKRQSSAAANPTQVHVAWGGP